LSRTCRFGARSWRLSIARAPLFAAFERVVSGGSRRQRRPADHGTEPTFSGPVTKTLLAKVEQTIKPAASALASWSKSYRATIDFAWGVPI
jgi:hypothetical protein